MANRSDIRTRVRDYLYEVSTVPSTVKLWTDDQLNRLISEEILSLSKKNIYLEEFWTTTYVPAQLDYTLPTGTIEVEGVEYNAGTAANPEWIALKGWHVYAGALNFTKDLAYAWSIRIKIRKAYANISDDSTATDIPDARLEVVVLGTAKRATRMILSYFINTKNWDTVAKPDGVSLNQISNMYQVISRDYKEAVNEEKETPKPRDIDLVG